MATLKLLLEGRAKDRGFNRYLATATKRANALTDALTGAGKAAKGLGSIPLALPGGGGGGRRGAAGTRKGSSGSGEKRRATKRAKAEREFNKAINDQVKTAKRQAKEQKALNRIEDRRARAAARAAKNIENLSDQQLREIALQKEINRRRQRTAKDAAIKSLPVEKGGKGRGGGGAERQVQFGANLAIAGAEFEQFGAQVERGVRSSFDAFKDFEKGVTEVSTLTDNISVDEITAITKAAASEFGGLPTEQVSAFYSIVSAGATDATSAQEQLIAANKLAIGGVAAPEEAVLAISKAVANFGDQGVDAAKASDILFASVQRGQTTVSEMARALPQAANAAATVGLTMEDTAAAIAFLSTKMPSASEAATGLGSAMANLQKPSKQARDEAKRLGIDFSAAGLKAAGGFEPFLKTISEAEKFSDETLGQLFESKQARNAIGNLLRDMDGFNSTLSDAKDSAGAAEGAYTKMSDTSAQKAAKLEAQFELLKITAGESLVPALTDLAETLGPIIKGAADWIKENPRLAGTIGKVAIRVGLLAKGVGLLASGMSMFNTLSGVTAKSIGGLGNSMDGVSSSTTKATKGMSKFGASAKNAMTGLSLGMVAGTLALSAFEIALANAQRATDQELTRLDKLNQSTDEGGLGISFKTAEGGEKSDEQVMIEQRDRLIADVRAKEEQAAVAGGGRAGGQIARGNVLEGFQSASAGLFNELTGVASETERQLEQAKLDLARFDKKFGEQIGIEQGDQFQAGGGGGSDFFEDLRRLQERSTEAVEKIANVASAGDQNNVAGPSMDGGLT